MANYNIGTKPHDKRDYINVHFVASGIAYKEHLSRPIIAKQIARKLFVAVPKASDPRYLVSAKANKKMRMLVALLFLISASAIADDFTFGPPISQCLNRNTIPYIDTDRDSTEIVNSAYKTCAKEVSDWEKGRSVLPEKLRSQQSEELHDFYIYMIDKRREFNARKK